MWRSISVAATAIVSGYLAGNLTSLLHVGSWITVTLSAPRTRASPPSPAAGASAGMHMVSATLTAFTSSDRARASCHRLYSRFIVAGCCHHDHTRVIEQLDDPLRRSGYGLP